MDQNLNPELVSNQHSRMGTGPTIFTQLILSGIVLILAACTAFLMYQNRQLREQLAEFSEPVPTPSPTPSDQQSDWILYTATSGAYSFQHPPGMKSDTGASGADWESIRFTYMGTKQIASGRTQTELSDGYSFSVIKFGPDYDARTEANIARSLAEELSGGEDPTPVEEIRIGSFPAYRFSHQGMFGNTVVTYASDGQNVYSITQLYTGDSEDLPEYKSITDKIFSTFTFLNTSKSPAPTCKPRPACLDFPPYCELAVSEDTCPYACPPSGYVDCMPGPDIDTHTCSKEAMAWYRKNCPDFKGAAL